MHYPTMSFARWLLALLLLAPMYALPQSPGSKPIYRIQLSASGEAEVQGTVAPEARHPHPSERYTLDVQPGQHLSLNLRSDNGDARFRLDKLAPAAASFETVAGASGVQQWSGTLADGGTYGITVFTPSAQLDSRFKLGIKLH